MRDQRLTGVFGPVVTPFDARGEVDLVAFAANARAHIASGLSGILVCGSTGEAALLDEEERSRLVDAAREALPRDRVLLVGTGAESTRLCVRLCRDAASRGADYALVVSPHYYGSQMTPRALEAHFSAVADASPIPVLLYNIPKYAHVILEPDLVARLAGHPNIAGMKDSAGDLPRLEGYARAQSDGFRVLTGHAGTFRTALGFGVRGGILAVALFAPRLAVRVFEAMAKGEESAAAAAQAAMIPLGKEIVARMGVSGVKAALDRVGMVGGPVRSPLLPLDEHDLACVDTLLREAWDAWSETGGRADALSHAETSSTI